MSHRGTEKTPLSPTKQLNIQKDFLLQRGLLEMSPQRINDAKLLVTLVHEVISKLEAEPEEIQLFTSGEVESLTSGLRFLNQFCVTRSYAYTSGLFFEKVFYASPKFKIVAALVYEKPLLQGALVKLNTAIQALYPELVDLLVTILINSRDTHTTAHDVLYEEGAGRLRVLDVEQKSRKTNDRFLRALEVADFKSRRRDLLQRRVADGWGIMAAAINHGGSPTNAKPLQIQSRQFLMTESDLNIDIGTALYKMALQWVESEIGKSIDDLRAIYLSTPYLFLACQIAAGFVAHNKKLLDVIRMPEAATGWLAAFSALEMVNSYKLPGLFISFERFPVVHFAYVQSLEGDAQ